MNLYDTPCIELANGVMWLLDGFEAKKSPLMGAFGGDCEIRTHGRLPVGSFQDCWFKPLTQVSRC